MNRLFQATTLGCVLLGAIFSCAATPSHYSVNASIHLAGEQGWDLLSVDESAGRVYVSRGDRIEVVDVHSGKSIGAISGFAGAHAVALAPQAGKGYATSGKNSSIVIFDLKTLTTVARIFAGGVKPDAIAFDSVSQRMFVGLAGSNALGVIDTRSSKLVGTIPLQGNPELMAVDGTGMLYVAVEDKSQVVAIDTRMLHVTATWSLAPGEEPTGLAIDPLTRRLFAGCNNHLLMVLDANSGAVIAQLPIGEHIDGVAFDPALKRVYSSGGDGTLTVVQEEQGDHFRVLETVLTKRGARTVTVDPKTHHIYLPSAEYGPTPPVTQENPRPRPPILSGTVTLLDVSPLS